MQVRMTTDQAGATYYRQAGEVYDLPEREAYRLIQHGQAEPLEPETAMVSPDRETTTIQRGRPRRKLA